MELDLSTQARMVEALQRPEAFDHPADPLQHLQTHISHVLLAGDYAYKIKKPLDLGFLDFSTLERRRFCCEEELRLNRRLAERIYLGVVPITGSVEAPRFGGGGEVLDYAVRMRRFPQDALLSRRGPAPAIIDRIADRAAEFHAAIPAAASDAPYGDPEAVFFPMQQNFDQIRPLLGDDARELARLDPLEAWTGERYRSLHDLLGARKAEGHVRECHGDMHLGNIALVDGQVVIFDGIEFNPDLRWIDVMNEAAFLVMDLEQAGHAGLARRFLNRWLERTGDYAGLPLLDFYKVYRALVRAKVTAIRLAQPDLPAAERTSVLAEYGRYVALAEGYIQPRGARLILTHGLSGSGKTRLGQALLEATPLIRIRSDVERKRLFGLAAEARTGAPLEGGIYTPEAGRRTYARLRELARPVLAAGYPVLVDATFLRAGDRKAFAALAREEGVPWTLLDLEAPLEILEARVAGRLTEGSDASEAGIEVLHRQAATRDPLDPEEIRHAVRLDTSEAPDAAGLAAVVAELSAKGT